MSIKGRVKVPEGMLRAALSKARRELYASFSAADAECIVEAALEWLAENPRVPEIQFCHDMVAKRHESLTEQTFIQRCSCEWQRRMFLQPKPHEHKFVSVGLEHYKCECGKEVFGMFIQPEPGAEEAVKDLLVPNQVSKECFMHPETYNQRIREAYRRGKEGR